MIAPYQILWLRSTIRDGFGQMTEITVNLVVPPWAASHVAGEPWREILMTEARRLRDRNLPAKAADQPWIRWAEEWSVSDDVPGERRKVEW